MSDSKDQAPDRTPPGGPDGPGAPATPQEPAPETLLRFPCTFPIKAMGPAGSGLEDAVLEILSRHAPDFDAGALEARPSRGGKWLAVTVRIEATSKAQLDAIYQELTAHELVVYAL